MSKNNESVKPEVVAAITAAVQSMMGTGVIAVKIRRSTVWALEGRRQK